MDFRSRGTDWRSILLLIFSLGGIGITTIAGVSTLIMLAINGFSIAGVSDVDLSPLASILAASTMFSFALLLAPAAWLSLQRLRGKELGTIILPPLRSWSWIALPSFWVLIIIMATLLYDSRGASWYVPFLHFLSIALPIYFIIRIGIDRIPIGSGQRAWGAFGSGMVLGPALSAVAEIAVLVFGLIAVGIFLGVNPEKMSEFQKLINQIENAPDLDSIIYLIGPLLKGPLTLIVALTFLSILVPIIEEIAKSAGLWLVADRLTTPAQGFALGILSGAGFALAESLFASITPDNTWALTLSIRAVSGSMHMLASGLAGWGIACARVKKNYPRMVALMSLAILLHGTWNGGVVLAVFGGARTMLALPEFDIFGTLLALGGAGIIFVLIVGMIAALLLINYKFRNALQMPSLENLDDAGGVE